MAARKTKEELAHEAKLKRRRERRAIKREAIASVDAEIAEDEELSERASSEAEGKVDQRALGRSQQSVAASAPPKAVKATRDQLMEAFDLMGGVPELVKWGKKNPTEFFRIWARLIPKDAPDPDNGKMPLETLLAKLAERGDTPIERAAVEIGAEALSNASQKVDLRDAVSAFRTLN